MAVIDRSPSRAPSPLIGRAGALLSGALLLLLASSCAGRAPSAGGAPDRRSPADLMASGLAALDSLDHASAARLLAAVRERCGPNPAGARATLLLAAVHLDPRNETPAPQKTADLAAGYLRTGVGPAWTGPVARVLYLEALEKGAEPPDPPRSRPPGTALPADSRPAPEGCRTPGASAALGSARTLPSLPAAPMAVRLDSLRRRVTALQEELERIREILDEP